MNISDYLPLLFVFLISIAGSFLGWKRRTSKWAFMGEAFIVVMFLIFWGGWRIWRNGNVVAEAEFNPGIAPFTLTVREVPVPVTNSRHFIVTLRRGEYPVTSFRYFWIDYTPTKVKINWPELRNFTVTFDDTYVASCNWSWGSQAVWTIAGPPNGKVAGETP